MGRYETGGLVEAQDEPGSAGQVLRNLAGVTDRAEMDRLETRELLRVTERLLDEIEPDHRFTAADIRRLHRDWLAGIYPWAGNYRQVLLSKGSWPFAAPALIPTLMEEFEATTLARFTPCGGDERQVAEALAIVHVELVLIHPFREGNGRSARLLALLMALQAGLPPLDFSVLDGERRADYFAAVRAGLDRDYRPMTAIFAEIMRRSVAQAGEA